MNEAQPLMIIAYVWMIFAILFFLYVLLNLADIYLPRIIRISKSNVPMVKHELSDLIRHVNGLFPGSRDQQKVVRHEVHHHYAPQYDQSHKPQNITSTTNISRTQTISDSVYYSKGKSGGSAEQKPIGSCVKCGMSLMSGWAVCPVCAQPIISSGGNDVHV